MFCFKHFFSRILTRCIVYFPTHTLFSTLPYFMLPYVLFRKIYVTICLNNCWQLRDGVFLFMNQVHRICAYRWVSSHTYTSGIVYELGFSIAYVWTRTWCLKVIYCKHIKLSSNRLYFSVICSSNQSTFWLQWIPPILNHFTFDKDEINRKILETLGSVMCFSINVRNEGIKYTVVLEMFSIVKHV